MTAGDGVGGLLDEALQLYQRGLFKQAEVICRRVITSDAGRGHELEFVKKNGVAQASVVGGLI